MCTNALLLVSGSWFLLLLFASSASITHPYCMFFFPPSCVKFNGATDKMYHSQHDLCVCARSSMRLMNILFLIKWTEQANPFSTHRMQCSFAKWQWPKSSVSTISIWWMFRFGLHSVGLDWIGYCTDTLGCYWAQEINLSKTLERMLVFGVLHSMCADKIYCA